MRLALLLPVLLLPACKSPPSPYLRITEDDGRLYYAARARTLHSDSGGFLAFKDLVTREAVRLKNGTYRSEDCTAADVDDAQQAFMADPTQKPRLPAGPSAR